MTEQAPAESTRPTALSAPPRRRRLWVRVLLFLVIFACGGATGVGLTLLTLRNRVLHAIHHPEEMPARVAASMRRPLNLTDGQVADIQKILARRQRALQELRRRFQPQVESELERVEQEVSEVLDESQRARWRRQFGQLRATWVPAMPSQRPDAAADEPPQ